MRKVGKETDMAIITEITFDDGTVVRFTDWEEVAAEEKEEKITKEDHRRKKRGS